MIYLLLALFFYTAALLLAAAASRMTNNSNLVGAILNSFGALIPIIVVITHFNKKIFGSSQLGIVLAILGGVAVAIFTLALNKAFTTDKVAIVVPVVFGGSIFLSAILSFLFFKEKISPIQGLGLTFLGIGLLLIIYAKAFGK